jgi:RNA recognition motif-containing protein
MLCGSAGSQGEVILFKTPLDDSCLYVNRLHRDTTDEELRETFSRFGLLHDLRLYETDSEDRPCTSLFHLLSAH